MDKNTMKFNFDQLEDTGVLTFQGRLTEVHVSEIRKILMAFWEKTDSIIVDLGKVTGIERPCLRIFCEAYRLSFMTNKSFSVIGISPVALDPIVKNQTACHYECRAEFPQSEFCLFDCLRKCLWKSKGGTLK